MSARDAHVHLSKEMSLRPVANPPNPWASVHAEWLDVPPIARLEVYEETARSILTENDSPDVGFRFSLNPYRGCFHGCAYCYARPTHQCWNFGAGTDFERKIVVKVNAPELLQETFLRPSWQGDLIVLSGNTDCYQPLELSQGLTRRCLEVCARFANPVGIITKGVLIRRDIDVLGGLASRAWVHVDVSIPFADAEMARAIEPYAPSPASRLEAIRALAAAGISVGVAVAPIIPGLNDSQVAQVLTLARDAGARTAFRVLLRLPAEVMDGFIARLEEAYPDRAAKVLGGIRAMRDGRLYQPEFGRRGRGSGPRWEAIEWLFETACRRLRLQTRAAREVGAEPSGSTFRRPDSQGRLFG